MDGRPRPARAHTHAPGDAPRSGRHRRGAPDRAGAGPGTVRSRGRSPAGGRAGGERAGGPAPGARLPALRHVSGSAGARRRPRHCCCIRRRRWRRAQSQRCCPDAGNDGPGAASRSRESRPWAWNGSGHLTPSACAAHWMQRRIPGPPSPKPQKPQKPPTSRRHRPRSRRPAGRRLQLRRQTPQRRRTAPTSTHCTHCCCSVSAHWLGLSPHQPAAPSSSGWSAPAPPPWNSRTT